MQDNVRILIVKASALGDIIMSLPMLRTLRHAYPNAYIAWVVESPFQDILRGHRDLDRLFVVETRSGFARTTSTLLQAVRQVRAERFDVVVDLQGWIKSQAFCTVSGARSMVGLKKKNELGFHILRRGVPFRQDVHMVDQFLDVARLLGATEIQLSPEIPIGDEDRAHVANFVATRSHGGRTKIAVLQPGTSRMNKRWSLEKLADVGRSLANAGEFSPVVAWAPREREDAAEVARRMDDPDAFAPPTTIKQLAALLERSDLYVGTDSGPMHLASALGVPTVAVFGPSDSRQFRPYGAASRVVRRELSCSPCGLPTCRYNTNECMTAVEVDDVMRAVRAMPPASSRR